MNTPYLFCKLSPSLYLVTSEQADHQYLQLNYEAKKLNIVKVL
jgi:hypothetical protein